MLKTGSLRLAYHPRIADQASGGRHGAGHSREAIAWLETLGPNKTLIDSPNETIVPTVARPSTAGARAMAMLDQLIGETRRGGPQLEIGGVIAEGGMGVIREAKQVALGRTVAVKSLKPARREAGAALDLLREAWVTGGLEHPSIVPVHAIELDEQGMPSIVLKRIAGVEWSRLIGDAAEVQRRFGADLLAWNLDILLRVLDALRFAHSHGVLHRDLKPSNVMIGDFGEVYLLDWGLAVSVRDDGSGRLPLASQATELAGTPCYMAPEMLGRPNSAPLGVRTDVYLAGAVLHEIVAGEPPHTGTTAVEVIAKVISSRPELPPHVNPELARICERAMQQEMEARFESIEALQIAIKRYLEHRGSAQLAERAKERLANLRDALGPPTTKSEASREAPQQREDLYRLFGACRYGFRDALAVWPENDEARLGLAQATMLMAEYELAADRPQAAVTLLGELDEPPPLLETARAAAAAQALRVAQLERLGRDHDTSIGRRTRAFLTGLLGVVFIVFPLLMYFVPKFRTMTGDPQKQVTFALAMALAVTVARWWARESMNATLVNRRLIGGLQFVFVMQAMVAFGGWRLGLSPDQVIVLDLFLYAVTTGMYAITMEPWLWFAAIGYAAGFFIATALPDHVLVVLTCANAIFTINALWRWWPQNIRYTAQERAARRR